jgi:type I restriction enzyme M protein
VLDSDEFAKFATDVVGMVDDWFAEHRPILQGISERTVPNELISHIADDLLARFKGTPLLDEYDVYEQLMTYWHAVMHDDVALVMSEGWMDAAKPHKAVEDKELKLSETPDLVVGSGRSASKYKMDLIPPALIVARVLADEQAKVDELNLAAEEAARAVEEYVEEHAVEDGLLADAVDDDKISKVLVSARLKVAKHEGADPEEIKALQHMLALYSNEAIAKRAAKDAQVALDFATLKQYGDLTMPETKTLVLDYKWHATVADRIASEVNELTQDLVARIQQLGERYAETVSDLGVELEQLEAKIAGHLAAMGIDS